jgi:hypothetical protein
MARHLLKRVRELWAEEIADKSIVDGSFDSADLIATYKELLSMQRRKLEVDDDTILTCIESSPAALAKRRSTAGDVFLMLAEREASEEELDKLQDLTDVTDLAAKVKVMLEEGVLMTRQDGVELDDAVSEGTVPETEDDAAEISPLVDEEWMLMFVDAYAREPFVHEYMHLRGGSYGTLRDTLTVHEDTLARMREVYSDYLNDRLEEGRFVRLYTPAMYEEPDLVHKVVLKVTESNEYTAAMKERLSYLYKVLFGDPLEDVDATYIFDKWVRGDRLSLMCDLNQIIVSFKDEVDAHAADMADLWQAVLGRKPLDRETLRYQADYRADAVKARVAAHAELVRSREFTHVITARIQERKPDMPAFEVYELLDRVLAECDLVSKTIDECLDAI